ncbi:MAG TPA: DUF721 domain-containing protein [Gemmatimonadales bacterium]
MANTRRGEQLTLGDALQGYLKRAGLSRRMGQAGVVERWATLVGAKIASVAKPDAITADGVLFVRVTSAPWMHELQLMSPQILKQLAEDGTKIKRIVWRLGQ